MVDRHQLLWVQTVPGEPTTLTTVPNPDGLSSRGFETDTDERTLTVANLGSTDFILIVNTLRGDGWGAFRLEFGNARLQTCSAVEQQAYNLLFQDALERAPHPSAELEEIFHRGVGRLAYAVALTATSPHGATFTIGRRGDLVGDDPNVIVGLIELALQRGLNRPTPLTPTAPAPLLRRLFRKDAR